MAAEQRNIDRRTVLAAIAAETSDRSGPMPVWLVPVAANARSGQQRAQVDAELVQLRQENLIDCHRDNGASGISLTEAGRQLLRDLNGGKATSPRAKPPSPRATSAATAVPKAPPLAPSHGPASVEHYVLCCDLGELLCEEIRAAVDAADLSRLERISDLAKRLLVMAKEVQP